MALTPSCDTLFFTKTPVENVITLQLSTTGETVTSSPLAPHSTAIFKVKCSAPQSFHVVPCYGAVLLFDGEGARPAGYKGGSLSIALNQKEGATVALGNERFSIEYYILQSEALTYDKIAASLSNPTQQTHAAKAAWSLVGSDTLPREHVSRKGVITLQVKVEGPTPLPIPPTARLVTPRAGGGPTASPSDGEGAAMVRGLKEAARSMKEELREEREKVHEAVRKQRAADKAAAAAPPPNPTTHVTTKEDPVSTASRGVVLAVCPPREGGDILMSFEDAVPVSSKGSVGVVPLAVLMVAVFYAALFLRVNFA